MPCYPWVVPKRQVLSLTFISFWVITLGLVRRNTRKRASPHLASITLVAYRAFNIKLYTWKEQGRKQGMRQRKTGKERQRKRSRRRLHPRWPPNSHFECDDTWFYWRNIPRLTWQLGDAMVIAPLLLWCLSGFLQGSLSRGLLDPVTCHRHSHSLSAQPKTWTFYNILPYPFPLSVTSEATWSSEAYEPLRTFHTSGTRLLLAKVI